MQTCLFWAKIRNPHSGTFGLQSLAWWDGDCMVLCTSRKEPSHLYHPWTTTHTHTPAHVIRLNKTKQYSTTAILSETQSYSIEFVPPVRHEGGEGSRRIVSLSWLALYGVEWLPSSPGRFAPREEIHRTHWIGEWLCPRVGQDLLKKRKIFLLTGNRTTIPRFCNP